MASIELKDSRRLTGPNLVAEGPGAVIDGTLEGVEPTRFRDAWRVRIREVLAVEGCGYRTRDCPFQGRFRLTRSFVSVGCFGGSVWGAGWRAKSENVGTKLSPECWLCP